MAIRVCAASGKSFDICDLDLAFYQRMGVSAPTLCPMERARRKLAWRNERVLSRRRCDRTGKDIISIHSSDKPYPVWDNQAWWSDDWDAHTFGRAFDFSRPFFEQFAELYRVVPQQAAQHSKSENCEYTNQSQCNKDCYLVVASNYCRDCMYGMWFQHCEDCVDCLYLERSQLCYEVLNGTNCFACTYSQNIENCSEVHFCKNCIGCSNCTGCVNLRNREYCFFNEQCSRDEYAKRLAGLLLRTRNGVESTDTAFRAQVQKFPHKFYVGRMIEDSTGDYLQEVRDAQECYNCRHAEHIKFCRDAWNARNCYDLIETLQNDYCIELEGCWDNVDCGFSMKLNQTHNTWYSSHCFASQDLFGCVGLRHAQFCILNRQYAEDEYRSQVERITRHMVETGEWGQFFPVQLSFFGYNETVAQEYFPLQREEILRRGWRWREVENAPTAGAHMLVPDTIDEVNDAVLSVALSCADSGKAYRITSAELSFYRKMGIPIPLMRPEVRHMRRMQRRNPRELFDRACARCSQALKSTFAPGSGETVVCEKCFGEMS